VFVFDVVNTIPKGLAANGKPVPQPTDPNLPTVTGPATAPKITVPANGVPPAHLVSTVLRQGGGPQIVAGETVVTQYTGVVWRTGKVFDSSWSRGIPQAFVLGAGQVIPGWEQGLGGHTVGSRILLVVPPELGYGTAGKAPDIEATDTLVFVVDIIAAAN